MLSKVKVHFESPCRSLYRKVHEELVTEIDEWQNRRCLIMNLTLQTAVENSMSGRC